MADTIGTAYVQIEPSFDGVTPKIESHFGGEGEKGGKSFAAGFGSVMGTVGKVAAGAAAAGTAAVTGMVKSAVSSYAEYEQLAGGIETLFEDLSWDVEYNAARAYETAGLSMNDYMDTVMSFSASLNQSLLKTDGNIARSAEMADKAITDMADNANKMGSSMESIQNAYQGFAKQNYTMLDNLKLGYGGTKEEMQRLLDDAGKLAGVKFDMSSYADIIDAIHVIQEDMGITGTTAKEGAETISGAFAMTKASWENLLTSLGSGETTDWVEAAIDRLVDSAMILGDNVMPVVENALEGVAKIVEYMGPQIASALPDLIQKILPGLMSAGVDIIKALGEGLLNAIPDLMPTITEVILELCNMLVEMLPQLIEIGMQVILQLALGIAQALPELIPAVVETVLTIVEYLLDNIDLLIDAAIQLIMGLAEGLINALPILIEKAPEIIIKLVAAIIRNAPKIVKASLELILMLVKGIVDAFGKLLEVGKQIVDKVKDGFWQKVAQAKEWGKDLIKNFIDGILAKWNDLKQSVSNVAQTVKDYLGFSEPDKGPLSNFHTFAPDMMDLFAKGINENLGVVTDAMNNVANDVMTTSVDVNAMQTVSGSVDVSDGADGVISRIESLLAEYLPNINNSNIYLDTGALVGATAGAYNVALGQIATRGSKR